MADCPDAAAPATFIGGTSSGRKGAPLFAVHCTKPKIDFRALAVPEETASKSIMCEFDMKERVLGKDGVPTNLPMYLMSSKCYIEKEVFEVGKAPRKDKNMTLGCLWSLSSTIDGQQLLTVWDTGAAVAVVPKRTIEQTGTDWVRTSDIDLVLADRQRHSPLGHAPKIVFRIRDIYFVFQVYVVEGANYQLLLGTSFIYDTGLHYFLFGKQLNSRSR